MVVFADWNNINQRLPTISGSYWETIQYDESPQESGSIAEIVSVMTPRLGKPVDGSPDGLDKRFPIYPVSLATNNKCCRHTVTERLDLWPYSFLNGTGPDAQQTPWRWRVNALGTTPRTYDYTRELSPLWTGGMRVIPNASIPAAGGSSFLQSELDGKVYDAAVRVCTLGSPTIMDLPRAIVELKDTPGSLTTAWKVCEYMMKYVQSMHPAQRARALAMTLPMAASVYLTYVFGYKPTKADVTKFIETNFKQKIAITTKSREWKAGTILKVPYQYNSNINGYLGSTVRIINRDVSYGQGWVDDSYQLNDGGSQWPTLKRLTRNEACGVVYGKLSRTVPLGGLEETIARDWGIVGTAYELYPWTWLLDQFLDIGSMLNRMETMMAQVRVRSALIGGLWYTQKVTEVERIPVLGLLYSTTVQSFNANTGLLKLQTAVTRSVTSYRKVREVKTFTRDSYKAFMPPLPSLDFRIRPYQLATGAALVLARSKLIREFLKGAAVNNQRLR